MEKDNGGLLSPCQTQGCQSGAQTTPNSIRSLPKTIKIKMNTHQLLGPEDGQKLLRWFPLTPITKIECKRRSALENIPPPLGYWKLS